MSKIGILHPGEMGVSVAAAALNNGHAVHWLPQGRSGKTRERAEKFNLIEINSLSMLCQTCEIIISICPPHVAAALLRVACQRHKLNFVLFDQTLKTGGSCHFDNMP